MATACELIEANGDADAFARAIGAKVGTVRVWKTRNSIPRAAWPEVMEAFPGVSLDDLRSAEAAKAEAA